LVFPGQKAVGGRGLDNVHVGTVNDAVHTSVGCVGCVGFGSNNKKNTSMSDGSARNSQSKKEEEGREER
jgi:hypothetical protein